LVKEAMATRDGHLLKRASREFAKNLIWMVAAFGALAAILVAAPDLPLVGVMTFVGASVAVMAAVVTVVVLWSGAHDETLLRGHHPGPIGPGLYGLPRITNTGS
jgi:uncharacterized RDD family membrane protein YckC